MVKTTFHKRNPWTGIPVKKSEHIDTSSLSISDDPIPSHRAVPIYKYDGVFAKLKYGQCVICEPSHAPKISQALRQWLVRQNKSGSVKSMTRYDDGKGRVWLVAAKLKAAA